LAAIYDGGTRTEAALLGDVTLQIVRDWVPRFNADGRDGLVDRKASGQHAVLLLDHAGWRLSGEVTVPSNMTLLPPPAQCPELNVMENVWQFMRDNWLSNRVFTGHNDIVGLCCFYWNRLIEMPWRIMSIGMHDWAHRF
jgi:hypothetical protein